MQKIGIVGATGNVGRKVVAIILNKNLVEHKNLYLFASKKNHNNKIYVNNHEFIVKDFENADLENLDICIFNTENNISEKFIPNVLKHKIFVIDSSSKYRLVNDVPLIVPPVNINLINKNNKLYAHANCISSPVSIVLSALHKTMPIKRVNITTYQSTSGAGKIASDELFAETKAILENQTYSRSCFKKQIAFNIIPQIGELMHDAYTFEEYKIIQEIQKVVDHNMHITATAVRVPIERGHSTALSIDFFNSVEIDDVVNNLKNTKFIKLTKDYATPIEVIGTDDVFVGRIRKDISATNSVHLWTCSDNLRRGAATDSVEILERILKL